MTRHTAARPMDTVRYAYARGHETVERREGESVDDFAFRACKESDWADRVVLVNRDGGLVAVSHGGAL